MLFSLWIVRHVAILICLLIIRCDGFIQVQTNRQTSAFFLSSSVISEDGTLSTWTAPSGQIVKLIGTAHLSQKSNEQVQQVIQDFQPNIVMVELDKTRLSRIGINSVDDIDLEVVTSEDILLPDQPKTPWYWLFLNAFAQISRKMLTIMYNDMSNQMKNEEGGGGEFQVAIRAAEACDSCRKLVLGDRDSVATIQRAAQLAMESGNPFRVFQKLSEANAQEMKQLEATVRQELGGDNVDSGEFQVAMMERLKSDTELRNRLFAKLEQEVPEFTQAFVKERDYIMSRAIGRELQLDATVERVVAVVGLAHVPGIQSNLQCMFQDPAYTSDEMIDFKHRGK
jgi:pheromone shutdown protein TraB